jgi:hypothetical protein
MESNEEIISNARAPCGYLAVRAVTKVNWLLGRLVPGILRRPRRYGCGAVLLSQVVIVVVLKRTMASSYEQK